MIKLSEVVTIILNWNNSEMTIKTFENIQEIEKDKTDFIIIDNGSENNEKEKLIEYARQNHWKILKEDDEISEILNNEKDKNANVILYILNKNYGYAKGNNFGLKLADLLGYKYAIIANNDVILEEEVIEKLLQFVSTNEDICVVGPKIIGPTGERQGPFFKPNLFSEFFYPIFFFWIYPFYRAFKSFLLSYKKIIFPYRLTGCFMLMKLDCMRKINFFDENTFLYAEEPILAEKLKSIGKKTAYIDDIYVKHFHGSSVIKYKRKKRFILQLESNLYYFKKYRNYGKLKLFLVKVGSYYKFIVLTPVMDKIRNILKFIKRKVR